MQTSTDRTLEHCSCAGGTCSSEKNSAKYKSRVRILQVVTLLWMVVECGVSLIAAKSAHSSLLLAFGADSLVELLSASIVLWNALWIVDHRFALSETLAARINGCLLFVLAGIVTTTSILSFRGAIEPAPSRLGVIITVLALVVMPVLSFLKRQIAEETGNLALAADSVQSATCAYLALITLAGLLINALFHLPWIDSLAALGAVPILILEGRKALRGESCGCC